MLTAFAFCDDKANVHTFVGQNLGKISKEIIGESGFAWDPIFIPKLPQSAIALGRRWRQEKTYAQMSAEEKNKISQRRKALEKFIA